MLLIRDWANAMVPNNRKAKENARNEVLLDFLTEYLFVTDL